MNLPEGVTFRPRQPRLIAKNEPAIIQISSEPNSLNDCYTIREYDFASGVEPYLHGNWEEFNQRYPLSRLRAGQAGAQTSSAAAVLYSVAEHGGDPMLPDIIVVGNLATEAPPGATDSYSVLGCSAVHSDQGVAELYEFQSYGMLALDKGTGGLELWVAGPGDKVAVSAGSWATLYNLNDEDRPLVALRFTAAGRGPAAQIPAAAHGPALLAYYNDTDVFLGLNQLYVASQHQRADLGPGGTPAAGEPPLQVARSGRVDLGVLLYNELSNNPDIIGKLARLNVFVKHASSEAMLEPPSGGSRLYFSMPLAKATRQGGEVYRYFFPNAPQAVPGPPEGGGIAAVENELERKKRELIKLEPLDGPLVVVVEGAGQWVRDTFHKLFAIEVAKGHELKVYYANDTAQSSRLEWTHQLHPWEFYLDKNDPPDLDQYEMLNPDVVFVATPDRTHSNIARWWLGRTELAPIIFVEKPFDSEISNVERLLLDLGRRPGAAVLGLDHYLFYALPIHFRKPQIEEHLGSALAKVVFYMTEARPIEKGRELTLQFGLTYDLLPHFLALLTYFGDVNTIDDIRIVEAGKYAPLEAAAKDNLSDRENISQRFRNETFSRVRFSFQDYSGNGYRVPCEATVGKGCGEHDVKYLEVTGVNGNAVRVDFNSKRENDPDSADYPWRSLFFMLADAAPLPAGSALLELIDPYNEQRMLRILQQPLPVNLYTSRYEELLDDLIEGTSNAVSSAMTLPECEQVVLALDRIWRAIQQQTPSWTTHACPKLQPFQPQPPAP